VYVQLLGGEIAVGRGVLLLKNAFFGGKGLSHLLFEGGD